jgi:hypothetical protein
MQDLCGVHLRVVKPRTVYSRPTRNRASAACLATDMRASIPLQQTYVLLNVKRAFGTDPVASANSKCDFEQCPLGVLLH